jgi:hypothetical protein
MAISFQVTATGVKATGGTTFTIALTSTSGDMIVVAISYPSNGISVSSVHDVNNPTTSYYKVGTVPNGTSVTTEIWATKSSSPLATGGTITVTVSGTGTRCSGVAVSYRGVGTQRSSTTTTGTTSPVTTGSIALQQSGGWLVAAFGEAAANAFAAQNGQLRNQITTTGSGVCLIDSNAAASPVTDSATFTAATWSGLYFELEPLMLYDNYNPPPNAVSGTRRYSPSLDTVYAAPPKFGLIVAVPPTIDNWTPTIGQKSLPPQYALPDYSAPPKFGSIPSVAMLQWRPDYTHRPKLSGYSQSAEDVNPGIPVPLPLAPSWHPPEPYFELENYFTQGQAESGPSAISRITIASWFGTSERKSISLSYATPTWDAPPKLGLQTAPSPSMDSWSIFPEPYFEKEDYYNQGQAESGPSAISPITIAAWFGTDGKKSLPQNYTVPAWDAPSKLGSPSVAMLHWPPDYISRLIRSYFSQSVEDVNPGIPVPIPLVSSWLGDIPRSAFGKYQQGDFVNQIRVASATLPTLLAGLAETPPNSQPQKFALSDWFAPPKFGLVAAAVSNLVAWTPVDTHFIVGAYYVMGEGESGPFVGPLVTIGSWFEIVGQPAVVLKYAPTLWDAPSKFGLVAPITPYLSAWNPQDLYFELENYFTQGQAESGPSAISPITIASWFGTDGKVAVPRRYSNPTWDAPSKFGVAAPVVPTLSGWLSQDPYLELENYFTQGEAESGPSAAIQPTVAAWFGTDGKKSLPQKFSPVAWDAPPKFNLVSTVTPTIAGWLSQDPYLELENYFTQGQAESGPSAAIQPTVAAWFGTDGKKSLPQNYAVPAWDAPPKFGLVVIAAPYLPGWSPVETYVPKFDWFSQGDTATGPAAIFSASLAYAFAVAGQKSLPSVYAPGEWIAPPKFGLGAPPAPTLSGWSPTLGQTAILLPHALTSWDGPPKFGLVQVAIPTLSGWSPVQEQRAIQLGYALPDFVSQLFPTRVLTPLGYLPYEGNRQVRLIYAPTEFKAPEKVFPPLPTIAGWSPTPGLGSVLYRFAPGDIFKAPEKVIPYIPALPTIESWTPTIGQNAQPQKFALPEFFSPAKFGLVVYPTSVIERGLIFYKVIDRTLVLFKLLDGNLVFYKVLVRVGDIE